ncbi:MAG: hypothetical protein GX616_09655 [Planctomycetes bacterium]|nr:hypothetical protein [Planctomycetota bacterium]
MDQVFDAGVLPRFDLVQGSVLAGSTMRGREIAAGSHRLIRKVLFKYATNYDNTRVNLVVDRIGTNGRSGEAWVGDQYGGSSGSIELTFGTIERVRAIGAGLLVLQSFNYPQPTGEWYGELNNLAIYSEPDRGLTAPDFDGDIDVDQADFGHLQACFTGVGRPQTESACQDAILDGDDDVDGGDLAVFLKCFSGSGVAPDPDCART